MKNVLSCLVLSLSCCFLTYSCSKELVNNSKAEQELELRNSPAPVEQLSKAISSAICSNSDFLSFLYQYGAPDGGHYSQILLSERLDHTIGSSTVRGVLNNELASLGVINPDVDQILLEDPDLVLKINDQFIDISNFSDTIKAFVNLIYSNEIGGYYFCGEKVTNLPGNDTIPFAFKLEVSERMLLVDPMTLNTFRGVEMVNFFDTVILNCNDFNTLLNNSPSNSLLTQYKWVNLYELQDTYLVCKYDSMESIIAPDPDPDPEPDPQCFRDNGDQDNFYHSLTLYNYDVLDGYLANQPCPEPEEDFGFKFVTAFDIDGAVYTPDITRHFKRNQLVNSPVYEVRWVGNWFTGYYPYLFEIVPGSVKADVSLGDIHLFFGGTVNTWRMDKQGEIVGSAIVEFDPLVCEKTVTQSHEFSIEFKFGGEKTNNAGGKYTYSVDTEYKYTAAASVECANILLHYCDDFNNPIYYAQYDYGVLIVTIGCQL